MALVAWDALATELPGVSDGIDVALVALVLIPAAFSVAWLLLPFADARGLLPCGLGLVGLCVLLDLAGLGAAFNVAKLVALVLLGLWFLRLFDELSWVVLVAALIPWADIYSVYRGPTREVVEQRPGVFERVAVEFSLPGTHDAARIGPPDVFFFALFLAASARFGLRVGATWVGMTVCLSLTLVATYVFDVAGLPALPGIALGFVLPNVDLLWRALRERSAPSSGVAVLLRPRLDVGGRLPHLLRVERRRQLLQLRERCRVGRSAREVGPLQGVGDLLEVLREHLPVRLDLVGHLVGEFVEELRDVGDPGVLTAYRRRELRAEARELRALTGERRGARPRALGRGLLGGRHLGGGRDLRRGLRGRRVAARLVGTSAAACGHERERSDEQRRKLSCVHLVHPSLGAPPDCRAAP